MIHFRVSYTTRYSDVNSTWLITSELANQRTPKALFTYVVYTKAYCEVIYEMFHILKCGLSKL